jgi:hypothetical protein
MGMMMTSVIQTTTHSDDGWMGGDAWHPLARLPPPSLSTVFYF